MVLASETRLSRRACELSRAILARELINSRDATVARAGEPCWKAMITYAAYATGGAEVTLQPDRVAAAPKTSASYQKAT